MNFKERTNERKRPPEWRPSLCLHFCFYLDTSKTSTRVGKKEAKEITLVSLLARHTSRVYEPSFAVKSTPLTTFKPQYIHLIWASARQALLSRLFPAPPEGFKCCQRCGFDSK